MKKCNSVIPNMGTIYAQTHNIYFSLHCDQIVRKMQLMTFLISFSPTCKMIVHWTTFDVNQRFLVPVFFPCWNLLSQWLQQNVHHLSVHVTVLTRFRIATALTRTIWIRSWTVSCIPTCSDSGPFSVIPSNLVKDNVG